MRRLEYILEGSVRFSLFPHTRENLFERFFRGRRNQNLLTVVVKLIVLVNKYTSFYFWSVPYYL